MSTFNILVHFLTVYAVSSYIISVLQWYNYKVYRVLFHFHKIRWHFLYLVIPIITYIFAYKFFWIYFFFGYLPALILWFKRVKEVKITNRVKRFFTLLTIIETIFLLQMKYSNLNPGLTLVCVIALTILLSYLLEESILSRYLKQATQKLEKINPTIIAITGSYGKTSIKNFLYQLLKDDFKVQKTPRSVNTLKGIVLDINTNLKEDTQIYIVEAGAREKKDIKEISQLLNQQYAILGKIGPQHIKYFKTLNNIKKTKLEIFNSKRLKKGFSYDEEFFNVITIKNKISNIKATLDNVEWNLDVYGKIYHFKAPILGEFNAINISLAIYQALEFLDIEKIQKKVSNLEPVKHRLEKIIASDKIIIDDSFNGNIEGMLKSFELVKQHKGRKIIVTPGIVEANEEMNEEIAKAINNTFDLAIITGEVNRDVLCKNITIEKIVLEDKNELEKVLKEVTQKGDLILFSNDLPTYL